MPFGLNRAISQLEEGLYSYIIPYDFRDPKRPIMGTNDKSKYTDGGNYVGTVRAEPDDACPQIGSAKLKQNTNIKQFYRRSTRTNYV